MATASIREAAGPRRQLNPAAPMPAGPSAGHPRANRGQSLPGEGRNVILRLYGLVAWWFDQPRFARGCERAAIGLNVTGANR